MFVVCRRLVERVENMKKNAMGNGQTQCILCGDEFGLLGASPTYCDDCRKVTVHTPESCVFVLPCKIFKCENKYFIMPIIVCVMFDHLHVRVHTNMYNLIILCSWPVQLRKHNMFYFECSNIFT